MLHAQFLERFLDWPYAPCLKIGESPPDAFGSFGIVLSLPFERLGKHVVERCGGILSMPVSVVVELSMSLW
jgi:hypothetical protein